MAYNCEILADSINPQENRLTTMKTTFPRMMLAETNTHRMFSRNSASSRAIPFKKMVKMVEDNSFIPIAWQKDHKGMQGSEYLEDRKHENAVYEWLKARDYAVKQASMMNNDGVTKQLCNRLLEPFMWHTVIVTASEFENFFKLRCPAIYHEANGKTYRSLKDWNNVDKEIQYNELSCLHPNNQSQADIHIQAIAELMWDAYNESTPKKLKAGEWHIPFGDNMDLDSTTDKSSLEILSKKLNHTSMAYSEDTEKLAIKIATARCARISYQTLGDNPKIDYEADIRLHDTLAKMKHWSPFEHVAKAMSDEEYYGEFSKQEGKNNIQSGWCRNFRGFIQYRHLVDEKS